MGFRTCSKLSQVDLSAGPQFFGSGAPLAKTIYSAGTHPAPYRVLKQVVSEQQNPTVGGNVQYGALKDRDFEVFVVEDYSVSKSQKVVHTGLFVAGLELLRPEDALAKRGFLPQHTFLRPFLPDIAHLERQDFEIAPFPSTAPEEGAV